MQANEAIHEAEVTGFENDPNIRGMKEIIGYGAQSTLNVPPNNSRNRASPLLEKRLRREEVVSR